MAPAETITSFLARTCVSVLLRKNSMPYAAPFLIKIYGKTCTKLFYGQFLLVHFL